MKKILFAAVLALLIGHSCIAQQARQTFTVVLTNDSMVITSGWGIVQLSVQCTSTTPGTIRGQGKVGTFTPGSISLAQGQSVTITIPSGGSGSLDKISVVAPSGCTLNVVCNGQ